MLCEMNNSVVLEAAELNKTFRFASQELEVLKSVHLSLKAGSSLSIRGESGCGKTTLLNILARIENADSGMIKWGDKKMDCHQNASRDEVALRAHFLGVVYQAYYLVPELDVLENVTLSARISGYLDSSAVDRAHFLLHKMGVGEKARQIPGKLSGGERQRVAIARAMLNRPTVLLADEPTGNLDEKTGEEVMDLLLHTCSDEGTSLILVTHNLAFAKATDQQVFLTEGRLNEV
jgi:predicted ABC-type transport system involved in lysophospholipase L1 biosynthesis ATPase subunit